MPSSRAGAGLRQGPEPQVREPPDEYALLDSGGGRKLERFGPHVLSRPCAQAVWRPQLAPAEWDLAHASFTRDEGNRWTARSALPSQWTAGIGGITFRLAPTDFGHVGVFPEQRPEWAWIRDNLRQAGGTTPEVLNLFAYSGGSTLAAAQAGARVCHVDASKGMVAWARDNAALNQLSAASIRWIVDDVHKFLDRERRRQHLYDAIILDPPTFGRGAQGEVYKIERDLPATLEKCRALLSATPRFILLSCHTPGYSPLVLNNALAQAMESATGSVASGELRLTGQAGIYPLPSGAFARWEPRHGGA